MVFEQRPKDWDWWEDMHRERMARWKAQNEEDLVDQYNAYVDEMGDTEESYDDFCHGVYMETDHYILNKPLEGETK